MADEQEKSVEPRILQRLPGQPTDKRYMDALSEYSKSRKRGSFDTDGIIRSLNVQRPGTCGVTEKGRPSGRRLSCDI